MKNVTLLSQKSIDELLALRTEPKVLKLLLELHEMGYSAQVEFETNGSFFMNTVNTQAQVIGLTGNRIGSIAESMVALEKSQFPNKGGNNE